MSTWVWGYLVWSLWLVLFLVLELTGLVRVVPWVTLSETAWHAERTYPVLYVLLGGFLIGLAVHIGTGVAFWKAMAFGLLVAAAGRWLNGWKV